MAKSVNEQNFEGEVLKSKVPVLVDFWAEWCGPCKMLSKTIDELAEMAGEKAKVVKLNIDECPSLAAKYGITSIPTTILFVNGEEKNTNVGMLPKSKYIEILGL